MMPTPWIELLTLIRVLLLPRMKALPPPPALMVIAPPPFRVTVLLAMFNAESELPPPFNWIVPWLVMVPIRLAVLPLPEAPTVSVLLLLIVRAPLVRPSRVELPTTCIVPPLAVFNVPPWMVAPSMATVPPLAVMLPPALLTIVWMANVPPLVAVSKPPVVPLALVIPPEPFRLRLP